MHHSHSEDKSLESNFVIFFNISAMKKKGAEECPRYYQTRGVKLIDDCAVGD